MTTSTAVERAEAAKPTQLIEQYRGDFATVLPTHVNADQWVRLSVGLVRRNPKLQRVARENPGSFLAALLDAARLGLEPGETYHLVPFGREVVGIVDYTGEIELMYRTGRVASVKAECVYAKDHFRFEPAEMDRPEHRVADWFGDRGDLIGAYGYAVMKDGSVSRVVVMSAADMEQVRAVSKTAKQADSPWNLWPDRMYLKSIVHQLRKWVPTSAEMRETTTAGRVPVEVVSPELAAQVPDRPALDHPDDDEITDAEIVDDTDDQVDEGGHVGMTDAQSRALHALLRQVYDASGDARFPILSDLLGRPIGSTKEITKDEAGGLIDQLQAEAAASEEQAG